ncbi:MAG TPA: adenylate/guanylate cyclase domain-containing protein, partial [Candidatus Baltobacteraceae bacterium]|nr:adenylate/guanylate cyclase domain-containing protein [Candidatus Baltobacteraceae bacterium]
AAGTNAAAGAKVAAGAGAAAAPEAPVAERRVVSVLFADLVGFTTLAEGRDAEDTRELLSHYFDLARDVIARYGGTVEKFIGDAVMAVWGAPTAHEDDAERAVRAGLELVDAVRTLGPNIQARAGVLTGEAAVTIGATNQGMVAGDLVNTASRLQSAAASGTVLVGEATRRAASKAIAFEEAGEQSLKGKAAPVPAWRALRIVAEVGGRNRAEGLEAPFVGRDDELRLLKDLFHATTREKRARLVSVIGPAGIGKTRLAWEFLKYVDGLVDTVWWHDGRSPAYGEGISFWALGEMVRGRAGLLETADEATTRAKIAESLATYVPDAEERRWIEPALLALLGVETGIGSEQLFGAWRTFFERLASTAPVVMVFEDFHFADSGLIDFVDHLVEWSKSFPIYVVTLARPELLERRADWGAGKRSFTSLYLEPLPEAAMRELLIGLVPGLPAEATKAIVARADGMPLYAVETVRMLVAEGRLAVEDGTYRPVGDLTDLAVPETLTALIASRLDTLDPADRALIHDAAVLGQSFTPAALASVSGVPEAELEPRLRALAKRELLAPATTDPRSPERGQYAFVQALIREVAYGTLAKADRKAKHLAAARFFEGLGSDELAGALAGHYLAAYQNAPAGPEAEALAGQARLALRGAAERAAALGANDQAVRFLDQAISVTSDPVQQAELLERAGEVAELAGRYDGADS